MATAMHVMDVSEATFEREVINGSREMPVVVDFWAPWCGPCRTLGPTLEKLAAEYNGQFRLVKVNVDENQGLAIRFSVQGIPAVKAFRDGKVAAEFVGAQPEPQVRQFIKKLVPNPAKQTAAAGTDLLTGHRWPEAEAAYRTALQGGGDGAARLGLGKALLAQGKGQDAGRALEGVQEGPETITADKLRRLVRWLGEKTGDPVTADETADAHFTQARTAAQAGDVRMALDGLLAVIRRDKRYCEGEAQQLLLAYFELLSDADPWTREYRSKLTALLF